MISEEVCKDCWGENWEGTGKQFLDSGFVCCCRKNGIMDLDGRVFNLIPVSEVDLFECHYFLEHLLNEG